ncbi:hypothetical protein B0H15DRAFT_947835 [Mycena belliarum]|uniref:Uncharacterized protein n=1 Tax=Mycena belliarum TaxID=1033014 RepID=A0AAD6U7C9_9AGAR|nr:hypothetical protein B0H15DRAFT_947835 [Mycena belliae]
MLSLPPPASAAALALHSRPARPQPSPDPDAPPRSLPPLHPNLPARPLWHSAPASRSAHRPPRRINQNVRHSAALSAAAALHPSRVLYSLTRMPRAHADGSAGSRRASGALTASLPPTRCPFAAALVSVQSRRRSIDAQGYPQSRTETQRRPEYLKETSRSPPPCRSAASPRASTNLARLLHPADLAFPLPSPSRSLPAPFPYVRRTTASGARLRLVERLPLRRTAPLGCSSDEGRQSATALGEQRALRGVALPIRRLLLIEVMRREVHAEESAGGGGGELGLAS